MAVTVVGERLRRNPPLPPERVGDVAMLCIGTRMGPVVVWESVGRD